MSGNRKRAPSFEWQVVESDDEWQTALAHGLDATNAAAAPNPPYVRPWHVTTRAWVLGSLLLVLLLAAALGVYLRAQAGLAAVESELQTTVAGEVDLARYQPDVPHAQGSEVWQQEVVEENLRLQTLGASDELVTESTLLDLGQDWAVVQVVVTVPATSGPTSAYRQVRVYRETADGWVRTAPDPAYWGRPQQVESRYFIVHYYSQDAAAVADAVARLDDLYAKFHAAYLGAPPSDETITFQVDPTQTPGELTHSSSGQQPLVVASPAATLAPLDLAAGDLLLQSMALALLDHLALQAAQTYGLPDHWRVLHNGLRLWLLWDEPLPLAEWREPVMHWIFRGSNVTTLPEAPTVPAFARDLCADFYLWMPSPVAVGVPVFCWHKPNGQELLLAWRYPHQPVSAFPLRLPLYARVEPDDISARPWPQAPREADSAVERPLPPQHFDTLRSSIPLQADTAALATVLEYVAATYGIERLPVLLAALPQHTGWATLIPEVFETEPATFEAGWQSFLAKTYGVDMQPVE